VILNDRMIPGKNIQQSPIVRRPQLCKNFFASVYTVETNHEFGVLPPSGTIHKPMGVPVITKDSVEEKLAKLKIYKSPGPDQLHPRVLFETREVVSFFKKSLTLGILPTDWKMADVTAIYKKRLIS